ncbi:hypothetical protein HAZT_HAZT006157 [Hyalella azteca]|uniref:Uncharacterized protein n=1 Tax=Hyalella azteca TaxID=294128 RepID=A0A6A0GPZ5_HYAAZ|nr:hypothetical protein HAZT_HAZT006157 [Hyalella azteca]
MRVGTRNHVGEGMTAAVRRARMCTKTVCVMRVIYKSLQRPSRLLSPSSGRYPFSNLLSSRAAQLSQDYGRPSLLYPDAGRPKRALFDDSCKGVYDRELFAKLDRVCDDCYNLYRKPTVSYECRLAYLVDAFYSMASS